MIHIISNPHTNPDYDSYMTDEQFINNYLEIHQPCKLISVYYNSEFKEREFVVEEF